MLLRPLLFLSLFNWLDRRSHVLNVCRLAASTYDCYRERVGGFAASSTLFMHVVS
jgi:hypothetical protein